MQVYERYSKELSIKRTLLSQKFGKGVTVSPLYPLLSFPEMESKVFKAAMKQSENSTSAQQFLTSQDHPAQQDQNKKALRSSASAKAKNGLQITKIPSWKKDPNKGELLPVREEEDISSQFLTSPVSLDSSVDLSAEKPVCFHCIQLVKLYKMRGKCITFLPFFLKQRVT